ncbi:MAG TPA: NAD-dependent epimerase/dehydratase family protein, partial [bacterium]|nr:NAD-dependent epimerase/dehydratase family protein [bacterium]
MTGHGSHGSPETREPGACLVTGATGFVGSHLAKRLAADGVPVRGLVRSRDRAVAAGLTDAGVDIVVGDITDTSSVSAALDGIQTVFHAAAVLGPATLDPSEYHRVNADGVTRVIEAMRRNAEPGARLILVSTVGVLGPLPDKTRADESTPPRPVDIYETTKLEGEERALKAAAEGFPVVIARPGWVYGPGDTRTLKLFRMIARRRCIMIGNAQNRQHPIFIDDLVDGLMACSRVPGIEGRVYHLCGPEILTVNDLCDAVARAAGVKLPPFRLP